MADSIVEDRGERRFQNAPFPHVQKGVSGNGPEQSRAGGFCPAERTLDGEDRSEIVRWEGKGRLVSSPCRAFRPQAGPRSGTGQAGAVIKQARRSATRRSPP